MKPVLNKVQYKKYTMDSAGRLVKNYSQTREGEKKKEKKGMGWKFVSPVIISCPLLCRYFAA
jgi:hypothetical protein